jgi:hypothetical protein
MDRTSLIKQSDRSYFVSQNLLLLRTYEGGRFGGHLWLPNRASSSQLGHYHPFAARGVRTTPRDLIL